MENVPPQGEVKVHSNLLFIFLYFLCSMDVIGPAVVVSDCPCPKTGNDACQSRSMTQAQMVDDHIDLIKTSDFDLQEHHKGACSFITT